MSSQRLARLVSSDSKWDSIVSHGLLVKLSTREFTILISIFTVAFAFLVARLFRVFSLFIFWMFIEERPHDQQMDQLRVAVVNFRTPFHVVGERITWRVILGGRGRARRFALAWLAGALAFLLLGLSLSVLLSLFPVSNGFSGGSSCSFGPAAVDNDSEPEFFEKYLRLEQQTALARTDAGNYNYGGFTAQDVKDLGPADFIFKSSNCPHHAATTACTNGDALNFVGEYWLKPSDLGVGDIDGLDFGVAVNCYKVIDAEKELAPLPNNTRSFRHFGLFYGPPGPTEDYADSPYPNLTTIIYREEVHGRGYYVYPYMLSEEDSSISGQSNWTPREDLHHEGDVLLLIYNLGAVYALEPGEDPLFATIPLNTSRLPATDWIDENPEQRQTWDGHQLFKSRTQTVSVVCNTSYILCDAVNIRRESGNNCLRLGGHKKVRAFAKKLRSSSTQQGADSSRQGFIDLLADIVHFSGLGNSAEAPNGVLASDLLVGDYKIQRFLDQISGQRELTRLFLSTRTRFLLAARRAVLNEWGERVLQLGFHTDVVGRTEGNEALTAMCKATLIPDSNYKTTTARPWIIVACVWFVTVLLTYSAPLIRKCGWGWADEIERKWMPKKAESLHSQLVADHPTTSEMVSKGFGSANSGVNTSPLLGKGEAHIPLDQSKTGSGEEAALIGGQERLVEMRDLRSR
ncbi:hypothetical protein BKA65DRAFT_511021 [Rhexocercosporidium sp. MPI-PUGE-AT-0058]|nr:hypothetical protein BKA65DRAFT_511021 [Rhexocercosporidium sp. MPI-PUGE-AT-0058]